MDDSTAAPVSSSDKLWIVLCHLSALLGVGIVLPLIVYLVTKSDEGSEIPAHARESLNFHLSLSLYAIISALLLVVVIGGFLLGFLGLFGLVCAVIAAINAADGRLWRYPLTIRFLK